jgi:hypothetical protein
MSTRCQIGIYYDKKCRLEKPDVLIYKHSDGYPLGTFPLLRRHVKDFLKHRGYWDVEYLGARLIQSLTNNQDRDDKIFAKKAGFKYRNDKCGFGICQELHSDIEYYYAICPRFIRIYDANGNWGGMKLLHTFSYSRRGLKGL